MPHEREVHALNALFTGEHAAVDMYELAIRKVKDQELIPVLETCRDSHAVKVKELREQLQKLGDREGESTGWFGALATAVEGGATIFGDRAVLSLLAAGEGYGLEQTKECMAKVDDDESFDFVEHELLPEQLKTCHTMQALCAWLKSEPDEVDPLNPYGDPKPEFDEVDQIVISEDKDSGTLLIEETVTKHRIHPRFRRENYDPWFFG
ncbi:unnamed protein product [Sphagnum balticum]